MGIWHRIVVGRVGKQGVRGIFWKCVVRCRRLLNMSCVQANNLVLKNFDHRSKRHRKIAGRIREDVWLSKIPEHTDSLASEHMSNLRLASLPHTKRIADVREATNAKTKNCRGGYRKSIFLNGDSLNRLLQQPNQCCQR